MNNYDKFIGKLYDILLSSDIINYDDKPKDLKEKKQRLENYLNKLDRVQRKASSKEEHLDTLKRLYYDRYVIKPENIPEGYFKSLEKRYLDEGHGHHNLVNPDNEIDRELKEQHINVIIREQQDSLDAWLNYFFSEDSDYLPMWAKVWAFQGMLGIGNLNKEKDGYGRRSNTAVNPFVSLDSEILGKCVELVKETFDNKEVTDKEIDKLVSSGSFAKLYGKLLSNKKQLKVTSDDGIWVKYHYETEEEANKKLQLGKEPEYLKLYNSLQGYNTGWCTAGSKETAKNQICGGGSYIGGDFYVYYTKDGNNEYKVPRIAIRMNKNQIGEIRGVAEGQNIESNMESVLEEKLKEFPDSKSYQKKVNDMKLLTEIYDNYKKRKLTKEELMFLYELNGKISGFGYQEDPRIAEIKEQRDKRTDLAIALDCEPSQIGFKKEDLFRNHLVYYKGDINSRLYRDMKEANIMLPDYVDGELDLCDIKIIKYLKFPKIVSGFLDLDGLTSADGLILPENVKGRLYLNHLTSAEGLILPQSVGGGVELGSLAVAEGLNLPQEFKGDLDLGGLTSVEGLSLPQKFEGNLYLGGLTSAEGLSLPQKFEGNLYLGGLTSAEGLNLSQDFEGYLDLSGLTSAKELNLPQDFEGYLDLSGLTSAEGLNLPQGFKGDLDLGGLTSAEGLVLPQHLKGNLDLSVLTSAVGLVLPQTITGLLNLRSLEYPEGLVLPQNLGGDIYLSSLETVVGIKFPDNLNGAIYYKCQYYLLDEIRQIQINEEQEEIKMLQKEKSKTIYRKLVKDNRRGFTTGIYTITMVLIITIISIVLAIIILNK